LRSVQSGCGRSEPVRDSFRQADSGGSFERQPAMRVVLGVQRDLSIAGSLCQVVGNIRIRRLDLCKWQLETGLFAELPYGCRGRIFAWLSRACRWSPGPVACELGTEVRAVEDQELASGVSFTPVDYARGVRPLLGDRQP